MHIWLIQIGETLPINRDARKIRTAYLADEFVKNGHSILWWASSFDHFQKKWIVPNDCEHKISDTYCIKLIKGIGYKTNYSVRRFLDHRIISWKFRRMAQKETKPDVIIASFPSYDLAFQAVKYAKKNDIPILVDVRDQWPDIFIDRAPIFLTPLIRLLLSHEFKIVKYTLKNADGIISMMGSILAWGLNYAQRTREQNDRVFHLGYKAAERVLEHNNDFKQILNTVKAKFVVTFIGTFAQYHNPSILLECAEKLKDKSNIHFVLAGDGEFMKHIAKESKHLSNLTLTGWLNQSEITELLHYSDLGVCTTDQKAVFFPNKAFAYMSSALPVISGFEGELKELIEFNNIGYYYPPNNPDRLCDIIEKLYSDKKHYRQLSENAKNMYDQQFNAQNIYKEYAQFIFDVKNTPMEDKKDA